jgi:hypothetical protein
MKSIRQRLLKLESLVPAQPPCNPCGEILHVIAVCLIGFYLGDPGPTDSVATAYARALGYSHAYDFYKALETGDPDQNERHLVALRKLMVKCGIHDPVEDAFLDDLERLEAGLSPHFKSTLEHMVESRCAKWQRAT